MARIARVVVPQYPHHIVQRGNRRQQVFFNDNDYDEYLNLLHLYLNKHKVDILSYCLMPNHTHLIAIPHKDGNLVQAIADTHRNYTRFINFREKWRGYLWQGRFSSYVLDERYLLAATRYVLLNPIKAGIVKKAEDYPWSSAKYHIGIKKNSLIKDKLLQGLITDWHNFFDTESNAEDKSLLQLHERTGRPLGDASFIERLETLLKVNLKKKKAGRKKKNREK